MFKKAFANVNDVRHRWAVVTLAAGLGILLSSLIGLADPVITSLDPAIGPEGTTVTINGGDFFPGPLGSVDVLFNGNSVPFTTVTPETKLQFTVPAGAPCGDRDVQVKTRIFTGFGGFPPTPQFTTKPSNIVKFTVLCPPEIINITPNSGSIGTTVTVNGLKFRADHLFFKGSRVLFNGVEVSTTFVSVSQLKFDVPPSAHCGSNIVEVQNFGFLFTTQGISNPVTFTLNCAANLTFSDPQPPNGGTIATAKPIISVKATTPNTGATIKSDSLEMRISACVGLNFKVGSGAAFAADVFSVDLSATPCTLPNGSVTVNVLGSDSVGTSGNFSWTFTVNVAAPPVTSQLTVTPASSSLECTKVGKRKTLKFTATNTGGAPITVLSASESSPNFSIASFKPKTIKSGKSKKLSVKVLCNAIGVFSPPFGVSFTTSEAGSPTTVPASAVTNVTLLKASLGANEVRFVLNGSNIESVQVQVFDMTGRKLYTSSFVKDHELSWNLLTDNGRRVANGVYLYVVTVRGFNDEVVRSQVKKLVILR